MNIKQIPASVFGYFARPPDAVILQGHGKQDRVNAYQGRETVINWLGVGLAAAVALLTGETFARLVDDIPDGAIGLTFTLLIASATSLAMARVNFHIAKLALERKASPLPWSPPNYDWPKEAEACYTFGLLLTSLSGLWIVCVIWWGVAS